jgi:predicted nuclease of predicted toxin-antitoxin system
VTRVLADENIPGAAVAAIRGSGVDVVWMAETSPGASDSTVLDRARSEDRLLLTFDRDFGELIYRQGQAPPPGVIYFRFVPITPEESSSVLNMLLNHPDIRLEGRFTTVTRDQVRQRPLP